MWRYLLAGLIVVVYLVTVAASLRDPETPIPSGLAPMALLSLGFILGRSITSALGTNLRDVVRKWLANGSGNGRNGGP